MTHTTTYAGFLIILVALSLLSCVDLPAPAFYRGVTLDSGSPAVPGDLVEAATERSIPSGNAQLILTEASPLLIGTQIRMDVLEKAGYAAWRSSRLNTLCDVQPVHIAFRARLPQGGSELQSGTIFLPTARSGRTQELTWLIFAKGTELRREYTPSRGKGAEMPFIIMAAALGYAVWVPDYSGMGDGAGVQEYCVADSLADSALDGFVAARQWLEQVTVDGVSPYGENGRLAIIGYSEGGLTVMGALKAIADQRIPIPGLRLTAVYPMGAPLNLALGSDEDGAIPRVLRHPEYQVLLALGWSHVYSEKLKLTDVLLTRTIDTIVPLFDGTRSDKDLNQQIAKIMGKKAGAVTDSDIFTPEYLEVLRRAPMSAAYYRLQEEMRLDRWTPPPGIPIVLAASPTDDIVPFSNSSNEYNWVKENAPQADVTLVRLASADHITAGIEAFLFSMVDLEKREAKLKAGQN